MRPRFTRPDPRIDAVRGCVAVEQGPLVLCAESEGAALDLDSLRVDAGTDPAADGGVTVRGLTEELPDEPWPYTDAGPVGRAPRWTCRWCHTTAGRAAARPRCGSGCPRPEEAKTLSPQPKHHRTNPLHRSSAYRWKERL
ncbi:hypothetical protein ACFQY4_22310 [Catellatospora bangladeshensis]|uniref:hypothetical protein n=1 Tax=Catellatospora bangladeshensis TaxID=310355 RepID=UPI003610CD71